MLLGLLFFHASADEPKTAKTASLVTYNVLADPEQADQRVPTLLKTIGDCDADVIALQEVAPWFIRRLAKADWFKKYHAPKTGGKIICPRGLLILSKQPITSPEFGLLPSKQRRAYLVVDTKIRGVKFKIATCHLDSFLKEGAVRAKQMDIIFKKLSAGDNAVFMGDFNFGDDEQPETKHLDKAYADVWTRTNPDKKGYTWNIEKSEMARKGSFPNEKSRRIDRILIKSKQAKPISANILGDKPLKGKTDIFPSDHFGLRGIVTIK
jgi:endonuclease/exonuclease/phosphatase family metal-dependent hydrolase